MVDLPMVNVVVLELTSSKIVIAGSNVVFVVSILFVVMDGEGFGGIVVALSLVNGAVVVVEDLGSKLSVLIVFELV